jgi:hypothetical protein
MPGKKANTGQHFVENKKVRGFTGFPEHPKLFSSLEISALMWALDLGVSMVCVFESPLKGIPPL